jgi:hypothetical protein
MGNPMKKLIGTEVFEGMIVSGKGHKIDIESLL